MLFVFLIILIWRALTLPDPTLLNSKSQQKLQVKSTLTVHYCLLNFSLADCENNAKTYIAVYDIKLFFNFIFFT